MLIVGILTTMSTKNSSLALYDPIKRLISRYCYTYKHLRFHAELSMKKIYNLGAWFTQATQRCIYK